MFLGKKSARVNASDKRYPSLQLAMGLLVVIMLVIGIVPKGFVKLAAIPAIQALGIHDAINILHGFSFWNMADVIGMLITLALGILVCWIGLRSGIFSLKPPIC